jgi:argininosuccinate synthase
MTKYSATRAVVAFSGGLDTSFCVPFVKEKYGVKDVVTCTVNTGGFSELELTKIEKRSHEVGALKHITIDAEKTLYDQVLRYLIFGNGTRDGYPLCVSSERMVQGVEAIKVCNAEGAKYFVHGSTGAGNDQYRFDLAASVLGNGEIACIAPVREFALTREEEAKFLRDRGIHVEEKNAKYSYNIGLWGAHIGGSETHTSTGLIPEAEWCSRCDNVSGEEKLEIIFEKGEPISAKTGDQNAKDPVAVIKLCTAVGNEFGIGRHYHVGTALPGKKGRIAYESPAADILYEAHRTLERITLTQLQIALKKTLGDEYARLIHEARFFDPVVDDLKAYLSESQKRVSGTVTVYFEPKRIKAVVADSPNNLLGLKGAVYGESSEAYSGADAKGASWIHGFEQRLYRSIKS